jgi:hypothetical protein
VSAPTTGTPPPTTIEADKFTDDKTAWDSARQQWTTVSSSPDDGALYILPRDLSAWSKVLTNGAQKPPPATWFVYNPGRPGGDAAHWRDGAVGAERRLP